MTTLTVTATQGSGTGAAPGILLRVFVITGAKAAAQQTGGAANQHSAGGTFTISVTIAATGSSVYGAWSGDSSGLTMSPNGATTSVDNFSDATNGETYGTFKSTATTSSTGATTYGGTVSTNAGPEAVLEILAATTLAEDASAPGSQPFTNTAANPATVSSGSFTPVAGSLLVALVASDGGTGQTTMTVSDSSGLAWTEKSKNNPSGGDYAGVWIADVPAGGALAAYVPVPPGRQSPQAFRFIPQVPVFTFPPLLPVTVTNGLIRRRAAARAVVRFTPAVTVNAVAVTGINGQPPGAFVSSRRPVGGLWGGIGMLTVNAPPPGVNGTVPGHLVVARRMTARAYVRFNPVETVNGPPYGFSEILVRVKRQYPSRAFVQFRPVRTVNAGAVTGISGTVPGHLVVARRGAARAYVQFAPVRTANLLQGTVPDHLVVARRSAARAFWRGTVSATSNFLPGTAPDHLVVARRTAARAYVRFTPVGTSNFLAGTAPDHLVVARRSAVRAYVKFTPVTTVNAAQSGINGTAPDHLVIVRRGAARAYVQFTPPVRTVNQAPAAPAPPVTMDHLVIGRRMAARAVWHDTLTATANLQNGNQPGGLVRRRSTSRAYWRGRIARTSNLPQGNQPGGLVKRRPPARGNWRGYVSRTLNAPPPPFDKGYSTGTAVGEAAAMQAAVGEAASNRTSVNKSASSQAVVQ